MSIVTEQTPNGWRAYDDANWTGEPEDIGHGPDKESAIADLKAITEESA